MALYPDEQAGAEMIHLPVLSTANKTNLTTIPFLLTTETPYIPCTTVVPK